MHAEISVDIDVPLDIVYRQWTQFESYPYFMDGIKSVHQLSDIRMLWLGEIGGVEREWYTEVLDMVPNQLITYQVVSGISYVVVIRFTYIDQDHCQVRYCVTTDAVAPQDEAYEVRRLTHTLNRFKTFIEDIGYDEKLWRGEVERALEELWEHNAAEAPVRRRTAE